MITPRISRATVGAAAAMDLALSASVPASAATTGDCRNGYVGLTYDDGPNSTSTTALLNALKAGGARATFFIWGAHARSLPHLLRAEQAAGMWIGNHTFTHPHLTRPGEPGAFNEINQTQQAIRQIIGQDPTLFRPPFGETNAQVRADVARLGLTEVLWTVDCRDWAGASTAQIVRAASTVRPGGIILMHDGGYQTTVAAVPHILSNLSARGLCPGRIVFTPNDISGAGQTFHAVAVAP